MGDASGHYTGPPPFTSVGPASIQPCHLPIGHAGLFFTCDTHHDPEASAETAECPPGPRAASIPRRSWRCAGGPAAQVGSAESFATQGSNARRSEIFVGHDTTRQSGPFAHPTAVRCQPHHVQLATGQFRLQSVAASTLKRDVHPTRLPYMRLPMEEARREGNSLRPKVCRESLSACPPLSRWLSRQCGQGACHLPLDRRAHCL